MVNCRLKSNRGKAVCRRRKSILSWLQIGLIAWVIGIVLNISGLFLNIIPFWAFISIIIGILALKLITKIEWKSLILFYMIITIISFIIGIILVPFAITLFFVFGIDPVLLGVIVGIIIALPLKLFTAWIIFDQFRMK